MDIMLSRILECMGPTHGAGKALADYLGVSPNVVTNWKNGSRNPTENTLNKLQSFIMCRFLPERGNGQKRKPHGAKP